MGEVQQDFVRMRVTMDRSQSQFVRDTRTINNALVTETSLRLVLNKN